MSPTTTLLEPSFLDLIAAIEREPELSEQLRRHWICSLRKVADWLDRPAAVIPARWSAVQMAVGQLHHARVGVTAKTLANHRSNARAALRWFGNEHHLPQHGVRLRPDWARFCNRIEKRLRDRLYSLIRYCSARGVGPSLVDDNIFDEYWRYRIDTTTRASNNTARRFMVRAWNACADTIAGCALRQLTEPPIKKTERPGINSQRGCAGTSMIILPVSLGPIGASAANVFNRAVGKRSGIAELNLSRWRAWRFGSACRSRT